MPHLQINTVDDALQSVAVNSLCTVIGALPEDAPIIIVIHGYKYSPFCAQNDPHRLILSAGAVAGPGVLSWPRHLGFGRNRAQEGLCIAFGWHGLGTFRQAYRQADRAGLALARLITLIGENTRRPVHILCHSLGARVALAAITRARTGHVDRVILMAAAEFQAQARACLNSLLGRNASFFNIISRETTSLMFFWNG